MNETSCQIKRKIKTHSAESKQQTKPSEAFNHVDWLIIQENEEKSACFNCYFCRKENNKKKAIHGYCMC